MTALAELNAYLARFEEARRFAELNAYLARFQADVAAYGLYEADVAMAEASFKH